MKVVPSELTISLKMRFIRSATFVEGIKATIDLADSCLVTNSGLELQVEMNGMYVESFKLESDPSRADGYSRLMSSNNGCNRGGRSFRSIASLADLSST